MISYALECFMIIFSCAELILSLSIVNMPLRLLSLRVVYFLERAMSDCLSIDFRAETAIIFLILLTICSLCVSFSTYVTLVFLFLFTFSLKVLR